MTQVRHFETDAATENIIVADDILSACRQLNRFFLDQNRRQTTARHLAKSRLDLTQAIRRRHRTDNRDDDIVRHVAGFIICKELLASDLLVKRTVADDWLAVGMRLKRRAKQRLAQLAVGVVQAHIDLPQNHIALALHLLRRQRRVQHDIRQHVDNLAERVGRCVNIIDRAVKRGVRIDAAAHRVDFTADCFTAAALRALEQ